MTCICPPVNGGYSAWGQFGVCSGLPLCSRSRSRSCTNPSPSNGGANCTVLGPEAEARTCSSCQRDGAPLLSDAVLTGDNAQMNALAYSRGWKTESEWDADRDVTTYEDDKVWRLAFFILVPILLVAALGMALMYRRRVKRWNQLYSPRGQALVLPSSPSVQMSPMRLATRPSLSIRLCWQRGRSPGCRSSRNTSPSTHSACRWMSRTVHPCFCMRSPLRRKSDLLTGSSHLICISALRAKSQHDTTSCRA